MPFSKRTVEPQRLCRLGEPGQDPGSDGPQVFSDLCSVSNAALSRAVRQLSDLARHASSLFEELERELASTDQRVRELRDKIQRVERSTGEIQPKLETVPVSSLDVESKLREHYQSPWHPQRNVFLPSTRPPCVQELHRNAKQSLTAMYRDQEQRQEIERERRLTVSIVPATPTHPTSPAHQTLHTFESVRTSSPTECCHFPLRSRQVDPDSDGVSLGQRSKCPIPNIPSPLDTQTNWSVALPLPTPEDRMRSQSETVVSCVVPIDVTGAGFDRDASIRCSLVHSQSVLQRRRKLRRRRTVPGFSRQTQQDSDESPVASERTLIVHAGADGCSGNLTLTRLSTRDSGCQTDEFPISVAAPSRRRIRSQRGQGGPVTLSHSTGNIPSLPENTGTMFTTSFDSRLRSRSLPREGIRPAEEVQDESDNVDDDDDDEEELLTFQVRGESLLKDEEESTDDRVPPERQLGSMKFSQPFQPESPEHGWMDRARSHRPRNADEISSSSDTFSSPIHSNAGVLTGPMDHKDDHQSSSGNWSGSSSTCPSQTSETIPPAASPPLTGSSHCDSELSLNTALNATEDSRGFASEPYCADGLQSATDTGVVTASEGEWSYLHRHSQVSRHHDFSPERSKEQEGGLECPSFTSIATIESLDKAPSDKADTASHFSVDAEGYYTSMHFDCGLKGSKSFAYNYASVDQPKEDYTGLGIVGRRHSLSLRKPKVKPVPPKRSSSLRKISNEESEPAPETFKPKIPSDQDLLASSRDSSEQDDPSEETEDGPICDPETPRETQPFKNEDAPQPDYADLWLLNDLKSNEPYRSLSNSSTATGTTVIESTKSHESAESPGDTTPSLPSVEAEFRLPSPEKLTCLASPSSGYSSQSETPTSSVSSAFFPNPLSPACEKRKPKVPERKSSLATKKDLELPIIPPTHLDLSALHNVKKPLSRLNHVLHNKRKAAKSEPGELRIIESDSDGPLEIAPVLLQLHSVNNKPCTDAATRPKCPTLSSARKPPPYIHLTSDTPSQDNCDSVFTPADGPGFGSPPSCSFTRNRYDRLAPAPLWSLTTSITASDSSQSMSSPHDGLCSQSSVETENSVEIHEPTVDDTKAGSGAENDVPEALDQVPDFIHQSSAESSQMHPIGDAGNHDEESLTSGVSTRSASQETMEDGSIADTEDYFSRESTPSDLAVSPLTDDSKMDDDSVFLSPSKSRTTEDLFAMIHRSKRKVLGRKDSGDLTVRSSPGVASPATSPSSPVTPTGSQRVPGQIYRNAKKSSTSNEEFKQLLLKKGSRSDTSYRMSATEILKSPVASRSFGDGLAEGPKHPEGFPSPIQPQSPEGTPELLHSPYPRANMEGFSTKVYATGRQSRSRLPPAAISSRYSTRRHYTAPMQAISEGETENSDSSPHDDRSS